MPAYSNSKVYKLINSVDSKIYIGSTTQSLCKRLAKHKSDAKKNPQFVHKHFNTIGWDTVRIILIETVECFNKEQLTQREQYYIDLLKPSLNRWSAYVNCPHGRQHSTCKNCSGASICHHNRSKSICKKCGGSQICQHNKRKETCFDCGGSQTCHHKMVKAHCKQCSPKYCQYCDVTTSKGTYKIHTNSIMHIYNFINH